jgi:hypothetical protein
VRGGKSGLQKEAIDIDLERELALEARIAMWDTTWRATEAANEPAGSDFRESEAATWRAETASKPALPVPVSDSHHFSSKPTIEVGYPCATQNETDELKQELALEARIARWDARCRGEEKTKMRARLKRSLHRGASRLRSRNASVPLGHFEFHPFAQSPVTGRRAQAQVGEYEHRWKGTGTNGKHMGEYGTGGRVHTDGSVGAQVGQNGHR